MTLTSNDRVTPPSYMADDKLNATILDTYRILATSPSSSPGPDRIWGTVLRKLAYVLALPVSILDIQAGVE